MEFAADPSRPASLAPIYAAILLLLLLGLAGFVIAAWPRDEAPSANGSPGTAAAAPSGRILGFTRGAPSPPMRWM